MKNSKGVTNSLDPLIYSKKHGKSIPYHKSLENSERVFEKSEKKKGPGILERIRSVHFGMKSFSGPSTGPAILKKEVINEPAPENNSVKKPLIQNNRNSRFLGTQSDSNIKGKKPLKNDSFLEVLDRVTADYCGETFEDLSLDGDKNGNITRSELSFEENLSRISQEFIGKKMENIEDLAKDPQGNVSLEEYSIEQKLDAVQLELTGTGAGPGKMMKDNIVKEDRTFAENFDAINDAFPNLKARQSTNVFVEKKTKNQRRIKGIHY